MWRLWTKGWGPRSWWYWFWHDGALARWIAWRLPHRVALWTFIRVYVEDGLAPGPDYARVYDAWEARRGVRRAVGMERPHE